MAELGTVLPPLNERVYDWLAAQGTKPIGPPFSRYLVIDMATTLEVEVGVGTADPVAEDDEVVTGQPPDGDAWTSRLELYLSDPAVEPDLDQWVTELAFRLAD